MKRNVSLLLVLLLLCGMLPVNVFAAEEPAQMEVTEAVAIHEHEYKAAVTDPTCTEQGYTTYTCECGESYTDDYVKAVWHSGEDGCCSVCGCDMSQVTLTDIVQYQGGVNSENGTLNTTFTNNWYADIRIPRGAEQVRVLTFKTGANWGSAFYNGTTYISGFCDPKTGGQWITVDIPKDATVFRYGYLYDEIALKNGFPAFEYIEFSGAELEEAETSQYMERPATGCHSFSVDVNIAPAQGDPKGYVRGTDYGYIQLPASYSSHGDPTRLILVCHGAGAALDTYQSNAWKKTNYSFWTDLGYAVMDMYACPVELANGSALHYGNPVVVDCYKAGYDYVMDRFNLKQDGIYVIGSSMGGLSSFQIAQSGQFPVLAQVGYCPVVDLFKQAYCNPWTTASYQRSRIAAYFGFAGTAPAFTDNKAPSAAEIDYYRQNFEKTIEYSPILRNAVDGDIASIFEVIPASATATSTAEAKLYSQLTATHPCPLLIFHNTDDQTVSYRYSQYFVDMINRSGQEAKLRTFTSGGHNAWANGASVKVSGINGQITVKESQYEAYKFFEKFEKHEEHQSWIDPAVKATCGTTGLTEGEHCAACGEVLVKQSVTPATNTHTYENGTCTVCGAAQPGPVITVQPVNSEAKLGQRYCVTVEAEGEGLTYQWYGRNAGSRSWFKSSVRDNTYDDVMTTSRAGREVYCVITDANGNSVTTETAKLICLPSAELKIVTQPADGEALLGERYCVSVEAEGEGLKYQWYFRNKGAKHWTKSSVTDSTYDDVMTAARAGREVYCVITDRFGSKVTTGTVKLVRTYKQLAITAQPADSESPFGEKFCVTVQAEGEGLKYQWFYRKAGTKTWLRSGALDNTYDDVMTAARANREVYCVITDRFGNSVTTEVATIIPVPTVPLRLLGVSYEAAAMGGRYCATVQAEGEGLTYQWYFRNAGAKGFSKSSVRDNTYDDVMNKTRADREVYCVITDAFGNSVTTETVTLTVKK